MPRPRPGTPRTVRLIVEDHALRIESPRRFRARTSTDPARTARNSATIDITAVPDGTANDTVARLLEQALAPLTETAASALCALDALDTPADATLGLGFETVSAHARRGRREERRHAEGEGWPKGRAHAYTQRHNPGLCTLASNQEDATLGAAPERAPAPQWSTPGARLRNALAECALAADTETIAGAWLMLWSTPTQSGTGAGEAAGIAQLARAARPHARRAARASTAYAAARASDTITPGENTALEAHARHAHRKAAQPPIALGASGLAEAERLMRTITGGDHPWTPQPCGAISRDPDHTTWGAMLAEERGAAPGCAPATALAQAMAREGLEWPWNATAARLRTTTLCRIGALRDSAGEQTVRALASAQALIHLDASPDAALNDAIDTALKRALAQWRTPRVALPRPGEIHAIRHPLAEGTVRAGERWRIHGALAAAAHAAALWHAAR